MTLPQANWLQKHEQVQLRRAKPWPPAEPITVPGQNMMF